MIESVRINSTLTLSPNGGTTFSLKDIQGLETPEYRTTSYLFAGKNGGSVPDQKYGQRLVSFEGGIDEDNCDDHILARRQFLEAIDFNVNVPIEIDLSNGDTLLFYAKFQKPTLPIKAKKFTDFQLIAIADDWRLFNVTNGTVNSITVLKLISGGARWLTDTDGSGWRWLTGSGLRWGAATGSVDAYNAGTIATNPIITITGANQNPVVRNETTDEQIQINVSTSASDVIVIDTNLKSTTLNGASINALVADGSTYFELQPGDNYITLENDNVSGGEALIEWYDALIGV